MPWLRDQVKLAGADDETPLEIRELGGEDEANAAPACELCQSQTNVTEGVCEQCRNHSGYHICRVVVATDITLTVFPLKGRWEGRCNDIKLFGNWQESELPPGIEYEPSYEQINEAVSAAIKVAVVVDDFCIREMADLRSGSRRAQPRQRDRRRKSDPSQKGKRSNPTTERSLL
jgi:hypothetical protein